jgi:hypothetical protein
LTITEVARLKRKLKFGPKLNRRERAEFLLGLLEQAGKNTNTTKTREAGSQMENELVKATWKSGKITAKIIAKDAGKKALATLVLKQFYLMQDRGRISHTDLVGAVYNELAVMVGYLIPLVLAEMLLAAIEVFTTQVMRELFDDPENYQEQLASLWGRHEVTIPSEAR